ncbi:MAG: PAS domain S-box protein [Rubrivivax sp.]|nr:PAS domain S-box protein [Rubrivivax sp.]
MTKPRLDTPSMAALAALRESLIFMRLPQPCWVYDLQSRSFLEVNPEAERVYGYTRQEFLTMTLADIRRPAEALRLGRWLDARARGEPVSDTRNWMHRTRDGQELAVTVQGVDFPCGERSARMVFVTDITLQHATTIENKLLYECLETAGDLIVVTAADSDAAGNHPILFVNRAFEQRTGFTKAEVLGRDPRLLQGPGTDRAQVARISRAMAAWQSVTVELLNYTRSGTPFWVEMTVTPVADEGGWFHYWFSVERDITERKASEQRLSDSNAELERRVDERTRELQDTVHELEAFSRTVSHDLQNPLNGVRGFAEMLLLKHASVLPADASRMLGLIQRSADQMHIIIEHLLALSRINSMQARPVPIELGTLCSGMLSDMHRQQPEREVEWTISPCGLFNADLQLLSIVLHNLLANAWKFTGKQARAAEIQVDLRASRGGVVLSVSDNGIGFDAGRAQTLFRPFQRLVGARDFDGLGIGLVQAARAAERLGGWLWTDSSPDQGARFHLFVPTPLGLTTAVQTSPPALRDEH